MIGRTVLTLALAAALAGEALAADSGSREQVNVNTATVAQLQLLPRVGPALAARIVEFRGANGPFKAPEELMRIKGIGEKSFTLLEPYVAVKGETTLTAKVHSPRQSPGGGVPAAVKTGGEATGKTTGKGN
jgi:competence protein ComEA